MKIYAVILVTLGGAFTIGCGSSSGNGGRIGMTGVPCSKGGDCPGSLCLPVGQPPGMNNWTGNVCTATCSTVADCTPGWQCIPMLGQSSNICDCVYSPEVCDGKDNDCDGLVDNITGCAGGSDLGGGGTIDVPVSLTSADKVDLLFMIDNSPSMAPKQNELKARFPGLVQTLMGASKPAWYHIGVVTSDLGAAQTTINRGQCHPDGDGGKLQAVGVAAATGCMPPTGGVSFIDLNQISGQNNLPAGSDLPTQFGCMASVGDVGCGFESQLESVYRALHDQPPENTGFLRDDALLVVVWVTDEDDCSTDPNSDLFDNTPAGIAKYGSLLSYRCTNYGIECGAPPMLMPYGDSGGPLLMCQSAPAADGGKLLDVQRYIDFFRNPKSQGGVKDNPNSVILASIAAPATPVASIMANIKAPSGPYQMCPGPVDPSGSGCAVVLQHSCIAPSNTSFFGDPAVRISQVVNAALQHTEGSICDVNYSSALQAVGTAILANRGGGCIGGMLSDPNNPQCNVTLDGAPLPKCGGGAFPCWNVLASPGCTDGTSLSVDWNGGTQPAGTTLAATCTVFAQ